MLAQVRMNMCIIIIPLGEIFSLKAAWHFNVVY